MESSLVGRLVSRVLDENHLPYSQENNQGMVIFSKIPIGDHCIIRVANEFVDMVIALSNPEEINMMKHSLYFLGTKFRSVSYIRKQGSESTTFEVSVFPFKKSIFEAIVLKLSEDFGRRIFIENVDYSATAYDFFLKQYKLLRSINEKEQALLIEPVLLIKEKFFKKTVTLKGIYNKLRKVKMEMYVFSKKENSEVEISEFTLVDFAALFRVMELGLLKFTVKDLFENFERGGSR